MNAKASTTPTLTPDQATLKACFSIAVEALTNAVLPHRADGPSIDFAGLLAHVLVTVAANVGSTDRLLAGRPGSWEADLVTRLIEGTVGDDPRDLWENRTWPVCVTLHVAELVEHLNDLPGLLDAQDQLDPDAETYDEAAEALEAQWRSVYRAYGQAFTEAVQAKAATVPGLTVPVRVLVTDDPGAPWYDTDKATLNCHPDGDALAFMLWEHAVAAVPLPVDDPGHLTSHPTSHLTSRAPGAGA